MTPPSSTYCCAIHVAPCASSLLGAALLFALINCSSPPEQPAKTRITGPCTLSNAESDRVPFARVDLGPAVHGGINYIRGPRAQAVVRDQAEWARLWKVIGDTVPLPKVELGDSVLVVVASVDFATGPNRVEIEDVRSCRRGGELVTFLRLHTQEAGYDYGDRSIRAVLIGRSHVADRPMEFVDLAPDVLH